MTDCPNPNANVLCRLCWGVLESHCECGFIGRSCACSVPDRYCEAEEIQKMSKETHPICPTCSQLIGGRVLLEQEISGLKELHKRELELRLETEKARDVLAVEVKGLIEMTQTLQEALDTAEEDLIVLGQRLLNQAKNSMEM